jgi:hypothetical protein
MSQQAAPGWYPDPQDPGQTRWWDGSAWTESTQPAAPPAYAAPPYQAPYPPPAYQPPAYQPPAYQPPAYQPPGYGEYWPPQHAGNRLSIWGIVCGAVAFLFVPPLFGAIGIVLSIKARRRGESLAQVALVVSILGLVLGMGLGILLLSRVHGA